MTPSDQNEMHKIIAQLPYNEVLQGIKKNRITEEFVEYN